MSNSLLPTPPTVSPRGSSSGATPALERPCLALVGNPNSGKTTLFNGLTGLRGKIANLAGTTVEVQRGSALLEGREVEILDLPGLYALESQSLDERLARAAILGELDDVPRPELVVVLLDATNLPRTLSLAAQVLELGRPVLIALNFLDAAREQGIAPDLATLERELGVPIVPISARTGEGVPELVHELAELLRTQPPPPKPACGGCSGCSAVERFDWSESLARRTNAAPSEEASRSDRLDRVLVHPVAGLGIFLALLGALFYAIFALAEAPMGWVETGVAWIQAALGATLANAESRFGAWAPRLLTAGFGVVLVALALHLAAIASGRPLRRAGWALLLASPLALLPARDGRELLIDGMLGGAGSVIVFLPQICLLFFFLALLEHSGYLARAAFVLDRWMRRVGLPGQAFVPLLSAHACAIPAILSTRVVENRRDRLATILVLPLLTCSARLPVYAMIAALLFPDRPGDAALLFLGAYLLGILAALGTAFLLRRTLLRGRPDPLLLELPAYRRPSLHTAAMLTADRALLFLRKAGGVILLLSMGLWALTAYPRTAVEDWTPEQRAQVAELRAAVDAAPPSEREAREQDLANRVRSLEVAHSAAGRAGSAIQPFFAPLGFDANLSVAVLTSFAAREVVVSTLAILYGAGEEAAEDAEGLRATLHAQVRADGSRLFDVATALALLVFFVLAMQCLPTQAVTRKETGHWGWAALQLGWMSVLAWSAGALTHAVASALGA